MSKQSGQNEYNARKLSKAKGRDLLQEQSDEFAVSSSTGFVHSRGPLNIGRIYVFVIVLNCLSSRVDIAVQTKHVKFCETHPLFS